MSEERVHVEFSIAAGKCDEFFEWLKTATEGAHSKSAELVVGYRADDYVQRRSALATFADTMEMVLRRHDHKTGWRERPIEALVKLMLLEIEEFKVALEFFEVKEARKELVDISNYALIVWDRLSLLDQNRNLNPENDGN